MRPIKLILKNIGPYRDQTLDFNELDNIFLITGDTGAGKTFIFDAITFALYGKLSGNRYGKELHLRSRYVNEEETKVEFSVEFEFLIGQDLYKVYRTIPKSKRDSKGRSKQIDKTVTLEKKSGDEWTKIEEEPDEKLQKIIGLKLEEFSKIVLLPQGAFAEFLKQNSSERGKILREIFPVSFYSSVMEQVSEKVAVNNKAMEEIYTVIKDSSNDIDPVTADEVIKNLEKEIKKLDKIQKETIEAKEKLSGDVVKIQSELKAVLDLEIAEKEEKKLSIILKELDSQKDEIENLKKYSEKQKKEIAVIEEKCKAAKQLDELKIEETDFGKIKSGLETKKEECEKKIKLLIEKYDGQKIDVLINKIGDELAAIKDQGTALKQEHEKAQERDLQQIESGRIEASLQTLNEKLKKAEEIYERTKNTIDQLKLEIEENQINNSASILADKLKPGMPCPVCGSTDHPKLAVRNDDLLSQKEQLKTHEANLLQIEENKTRTGNDIAVEKTKKSACEKILLDLNSIRETDLICEELNSVTVLYKKKTDERNEVIEDQKQIETLKESLSELKDSFNKAENDYSAAKAKRETLEKNIGNGETYSSLNEKYEMLREKIESDTKRVDEWQDNLVKTQNAVSAVQAKIEQCKKILSDEETILNSSDLKEQLSEMESKSAELTDSYDQIKIDLKKKNDECVKYKNAYNKIKDAQKKYDALQKETEPLVKLNDDLTGKNPRKIQFDAWALGMYFEQVVSFASKRFEDISNGRFKFQLKDIADDTGRGYKGLDLMILDTYTGTMSEPCDLSGGEVFEASISLALALTDVVQNNNGGIQLDSLFIDEGFGTLDSETMDKAMQVLTELGERKMVGLISHVEGIQNHDFITKIVDVHKTKNGSWIEIKDR